MREIPDRYEFEFEGGPANVFIFTTTDEVRYQVKFVPSSEYFEDYEALEMEAFEMIIAVADNPIGGRPRFDERIEPTIFAIFEEFFIHQRHVIVFICETHDNRGEARFRKFGMWFMNRARRTKGELAKLDQTIKGEDVNVYMSLILSRYHPHFRRIADIFFSLGEGQK